MMRESRRFWKSGVEAVTGGQYRKVILNPYFQDYLILFNTR